MPSPVAIPVKAGVSMTQCGEFTGRHSPKAGLAGNDASPLPRTVMRSEVLRGGGILWAPRARGWGSKIWTSALAGRGRHSLSRGQNGEKADTSQYGCWAPTGLQT